MLCHEGVRGAGGEVGSRCGEALRILGIIYIVLGCIGILLTALAGILTVWDLYDLTVEEGFFDYELLALAVLILLLLLALASFQIVFGRALQRQCAWATRAVGFVVAFLSLFSIPFGTALGVYPFWVLIKIDQVEALKNS